MKKYFNEFEDFTIGDRVFVLGDGWHKITNLTEHYSHILCKSEETGEDTLYKPTELFFAEFSLPDQALERPKRRALKEFDSTATFEKIVENRAYDFVFGNYGFIMDVNVRNSHTMPPTKAKINIKFEVEE